MTGQVKEDVITRFNELGVDINNGEISFSPALLKREELISEPRTWHYSTGGAMQSEQLEADCLAFSLCGVPVIYQLSEKCSIEIQNGQADLTSIPGNRLNSGWSQSIFQRKKQIQKITVKLPKINFRP